MPADAPSYWRLIGIDVGCERVLAIGPHPNAIVAWLCRMDDTPDAVYSHRDLLGIAGGWWERWIADKWVPQELDEPRWRDIKRAAWERDQRYAKEAVGA